MNGGKQRVLLLRNVFMLHRSSSLILPLSPLGLCVFVSWRIPANMELNSCLAKIGSLWSNMNRKKNPLTVIKAVCIVCNDLCLVYLQPNYFMGRTQRSVAVLPVLVLEGGWWGYCMRSGCLESLPVYSYDRELLELLFAAFDQLFLPVGHPTKPLMVRDTDILEKLDCTVINLTTFMCYHPAFQKWIAPRINTDQYIGICMFDTLFCFCCRISFCA